MPYAPLPPGDWHAYPTGRRRGPPPELEAPAGDLAGLGVVGLGAFCDLADTTVEDRRRASFDVSEFAVLEDGRRVVLHYERGFTGHLSRDDDIWRYQTEDSIRRDVLNTVLPDEDPTEDEHPWEWLAGLCRARGITTTVEELKAVPYEVILSDRVLARLART